MTTQPSSDSTLSALAQSLGLRFLSEVPDAFFSQKLSSLMPMAWARSQTILPILLDGQACLLTASPDDLETQHKASLVTGTTLVPVLASPSTILDAIARCYASVPSIPSPSQSPSPTPPPSPSSSVTDLLSSPDSSSQPVTQLVNSILLQAVRDHASDVHFEPFANHTTVRFRIDGVLYERASPPKELESALISRLKVMAGMDIAEKRLPQDGMAQVRAGGKSIDIRVSSVPVSDGERIVLRLLNRDDACLPIASLGMNEAMLARFHALTASPNGIIIVSGPTGSGKTTTLYAALGELDSSHRNILTIEDPVEYRLPSIGQIQVKPKIGLTFASGLRHILRQDPDIVLVGETRDPETAEIAVRASLTGHLVFTTLHTNDAPSAIMRLVDMGIPPYLLASSLRGVLAQRLVRTLCPHCRIPNASPTLPPPELHINHSFHAPFSASSGCNLCLSGYKGRQGIFELMSCSPTIAELIRHGATDSAAITAAAQEAGMRPMIEDALEKVAAGITDLSEIAGVLSL